MSRFAISLVALGTLLVPLSSAADWSAEALIAHHAVATDVTYRGRPAIRVSEPTREPGSKPDLRDDNLAILPGTSFQDGSIELWISGSVTKGAPEQARGFVGIAFRVAPDQSDFEAIYLRPANAREDNQLQRNHSIQYISFPEYPWHRLRKETPGQYESYSDMALGEWTRFRLEVKGTTARLFLHDNAQPSLIVNDLKHGRSAGSIALWIGPGTIAHFTEPVVTVDGTD